MSSTMSNKASDKLNSPFRKNFQKNRKASGTDETTSSGPTAATAMADFDTSHDISLESRIRGAFIGLAVCDALGGPPQFQRRGTFAPVTSMIPNRNFGLGPGYFSDDTSMALCLAHSLLENDGKANTRDQAEKYIAWIKHGWMASTEEAFDVGLATRGSLTEWERLLTRIDRTLEGVKMYPMTFGQVQSMIEERFNQERYCGNGSLMRVLPVALIVKDERDAVEVAGTSSKITHPNPRCQDACKIYTACVCRVLHGATKNDIVNLLFQVSQITNAPTDPPPSENTNAPSQVSISSDTQTPTITIQDPVLLSRFSAYPTPEHWTSQPSTSISSSGYVVDSLEAALWAFFTTDDFRAGAVKVVNLGDDADSVGAIYGGIAGAFYGHEQIPPDWLADMKAMDLVEDVVEKIVARASDLSLSA